MKYISLFSGIGGFEIAIHNIFPQAKCLGYSEIDKFALKVYKHHFPEHKNMGDIEDIKERDIKRLLSKEGCDLLVGGFPCTNLTSLARQHSHCNSEGLEGPKSGLFWKMLNIIKWIQKHNPKGKKLNLIIENNASMKKVYKETITSQLQKLFKTPISCTMLNGADFGVQTRRRLYWTTFEVDNDNIICSQTWKDVLEPLKKINNFLGFNHIVNTGNKIFKNTRSNYTVILENVEGNIWKENKIIGNHKSNWQLDRHSTIKNEKSVPVTRNRNIHCSIWDYRVKKKDCFYVRYFESVETERLFFIPEGWVSDLCSKTRCQKLLGNTVIVKVIEFILKQMKH